MSLAAIAASSIGNVKNELGGDEKYHVKGTFTEDRIISSLLVAVPSSILSVVYLFSAGYFSSGILTCSLTDPPISNSSISACGSSCDNYKLADYEFIKAYCYSRMKNYDVNEANGAVDYASKHSLVYMKLYPYSLFGLAFLGLLTTVVWELSAAKRAGQTSYIIDGIEEAMGELISALKETSLILCREEIKSDTNKKAKRYANFRTTCKTKSRLNSIEETIGNQFNGELEATKMGSKKNSVAPDFIISEEELKNEVFKIWNENGTKDKFVELEELMARRLRSKQLYAAVIFTRLFSMILTCVGFFVVTYYYVGDNLGKNHMDSFNCLLPRAYHYLDMDGNKWETTKCYIKSIPVYKLTASILSFAYLLIFIAQIFTWIKHVSRMRRSYKLIQYLPLPEAEMMMNHSVSDLHLVMDLVNQNGHAKNNIWVGYKVLSALYPDERSKFLQVLLEVIVWNATDENVDEIVNKIVHSKQL